MDLKTILAIVTTISTLAVGFNWHFEIEKGKGLKQENMGYRIQVSSLGKKECK